MAEEVLVGHMIGSIRTFLGQRGMKRDDVGLLLDGGKRHKRMSFHIIVSIITRRVAQQHLHATYLKVGSYQRAYMAYTNDTYR